jgi:hypothetical protein
MNRHFLKIVFGLLALTGSEIIASAQVLTVTGSGTWGPAAPTTTWTAPNGTWQFSLQISQAPLQAVGCSGAPYGPPNSTQFDVYFTNFRYSLNGVTVSTCPSYVGYYASGQGGGFLLDDFGGVNNGFLLDLGAQLFTGSTSSPVLLTGTFPAQNSEFGWAIGNGLYDNFYVSTGTLIISAGCQVSPSPPPISQFGEPPAPPPNSWGLYRYDNLSSRSKGLITIAMRGCALTSLNMALNFAGESWNPETLNSLLNATGGYDPPPAGTVRWGPATAASNGGRVGNPVIFDDLGGWANSDGSDANLAKAVATVESGSTYGICSGTPYPVIVGVRSRHPNASGVYEYPGHFVLITGEIVNPDGSKAFTINDPAGYSTVLGTDASTGISGYTNGSGQPEFWTRGVVHDAADLTGLSVSVDSTANLMVTDPNGLQSGFYPGNPDPIQFIPHSGAGQDEIDDDVTGDAGSPVQSVMINSPTAGAFQISLTGAAAGEFTLSVSAVGSDGAVQTSSFPGVTNVGSTATYQLEYNPSPGSSSTPTLIATFQSTLADIKNSLQLGLITTDHLADSLAWKIRRASEATGEERADILWRFKEEVEAYSKTKESSWQAEPRNKSGKDQNDSERDRSHVTGVAVQVLLNDADSLLEQAGYSPQRGHE